MSSDILELYIDERLDQSEVLRMTIPAGSPKAYLLEPDVELRWRDRRFRVVELEEERDGAETTITVEAEAVWYELGDLTYVGSLVLTAVTPLAGLTTILDGTGWTPADDPTLAAIATTYNLELEDRTRLELVRAWAKVTGLDVEFDTLTRTVNLTATRGVDLGLAFRYRRNLRRLRRRARPPDVTVLYPYGADDLTIAGVNGGLPYVEDFTYYTALGLSLEEARARYTRSRVWSDATFLTDTELLGAAEARLAELAQPVITYELGVVDLAEQTNDVDITPNVGDTVRVNDPDFGHDIRTTVVRVVRHPNEPHRNVIELANLPDPVGDSSARSSRPARSEDWHQFVGPVAGDYELRNDGVYTVARIPLTFRNGGRANFHLDLFATAVGDGVLEVSVEDASNGNAEQFYALEVPYTDGELVRAFLQWATEDLVGQYDFRVRVTAAATGGPLPSAGADITADVGGEASFWVMAQGAVRETPTAANSQRFDYDNDEVQTFTVPDNVTEVVIEAVGASGGGAGGAGGKVVATFPVTPGQVFDVYAPSAGSGATSAGGWPGGGQGGNLEGSPNAAGGGGYAAVIPTGGTLIDALLVAGAGGGGSEDATNDGPGGDGGFFHGGDADGDWNAGSDANDPGRGATQFAGGQPQSGTNGSGEHGSFGQGGTAHQSGSAFAYASGGGGAGWYGGGAAGPPSGNGRSESGGSGGGGSGWVDPDSGYSDLELDDGFNSSGNGYVEFRWEDPLA
jgi:phage minor structural protein